jgi:hypothetical protein
MIQSPSFVVLLTLLTLLVCCCCCWLSFFFVYKIYGIEILVCVCKALSLSLSLSSILFYKQEMIQQQAKQQQQSAPPPNTQTTMSITARPAKANVQHTHALASDNSKRSDRGKIQRENVGQIVKLTARARFNCTDFSINETLHYLQQ